MMSPALLRVFAEQVLNSGTDISESEELQAPAKHYPKLSSTMGETEQEWFRKFSKGTSSFHSFPDHKTFFKFQYNIDIELFEKWR